MGLVGHARVFGAGLSRVLSTPARKSLKLNASAFFGWTAVFRLRLGNGRRRRRFHHRLRRRQFRRGFGGLWDRRRRNEVLRLGRRCGRDGRGLRNRAYGRRDICLVRDGDEIDRHDRRRLVEDVERVREGEQRAPMTRDMQNKRAHQPEGRHRRCRRLGDGNPSPMPVVLRLCDICHQPDMGEPRRTDQRHDFHDAAIIDGFVAAHKNALVVAIAGDRGQLAAPDRLPRPACSADRCGRRGAR